MAERNILLQPSGIPGVPVPTPAITEEGFAPAIRKLAQQYAQQAQESVGGYLGQRGLLESSFLPNMLERAYQGGFGMAMQDFQSQQKLFMGYSQQLMAMRSAAGPEQQQQPWWQRALMGAAGGAIAGGQIGGGVGAGWGAIIGAVAGPSIIQ